MSKYAPGREIHFPHTGNSYVITVVAEAEQLVTFARPFDLEDHTTETMADLDAVDVEVRD